MKFVNPIQRKINPQRIDNLDTHLYWATIPKISYNKLYIKLYRPIDFLLNTNLYKPLHASLDTNL